MYKVGDEVEVEVDGVWRDGVVTVVTELGSVAGEAKIPQTFIVRCEETAERLRPKPEPSFMGSYCRACDEGDPCDKHNYPGAPR